MYFDQKYQGYGIINESTSLYVSMLTNKSWPALRILVTSYMWQHATFFIKTDYNVDFYNGMDTDQRHIEIST